MKSPTRRSSCEPPAGRRPVAAALQPFVDRGWLAGVVALVADKDRVLSLDALGSADRAGKRRMRADTLFWIASLTKPITATALMMLVDKGKVRLRDPVEKYLPEFKDLWVVAGQGRARMVLRRPGRRITLHDLLTHTSGMGFGSAIETPTLDLLPLSLAVRSYAMTPLQSQPGRRYQYSNAGINTLGRIIELVGGLPYEEFLARHLFRPLGMRDTTFVPSGPRLARLAKAYEPNKAKTRLRETLIPQLKYPLSDPSRQPMPAGGLFSTAGDLARFCQMILRGGTFRGKRHLSRAAIRQMTRRHTPRSFEKGYGLGWTSEKNVFGHGGAFGSRMGIRARTGRITVYLIQHGGFLGKGKQGGEVFQQAAAKVGDR